MSDVIQVRDEFYILATAALESDRGRVLKQGDSFLTIDRFGDLRTLGVGSDGLFHEGTRFLSKLELRIAGARPLLLSSDVLPDNSMFVAHLTNPDLTLEGREFRRDTVHVMRSLVLHDGRLHHELRLRSYHPEPIVLRVQLAYAADFADIFEVRGSRRARRGDLAEPVVDRAGGVVLGYRGLDHVWRRTRLSFSPQPRTLDGGCADFAVHLAPGAGVALCFAAACEIGDASPAPVTFAAAVEATRSELARGASRGCTVATSNEDFNEWIDRSRADLAMMTTATPSGLYPYAGVPWFCCPFGRDGLVTAFETLWIDPALTRGVLQFLADTQATVTDPARDAEPGKILHEARGGEMAALGEIPFGRYYGSADATPLFVLLAAEYWKRTADGATVERIWPNLTRALAWVGSRGDRDGDGFLEYAPHLPTGLRHQGWKDSEDSVSHADGTLAEGPIALCEIQAYVHAALLGAATVADVLGHGDDARTWRDAAVGLRERFEAQFWSDALGTYVLALDGDKRPCDVRSSNAGHCLFAGIAAPERARRVAESLLGASSYSGWGIRTLDARERRYNPMSYHNGSVWPHDNALIAAGLGRYGLRTLACDVLSGLFHASRPLALHRMPELFCGFARHAGDGPTLYPVACLPQAWSAGAVFLLIAACIGVTIDGAARRVTFTRSLLPEYLDLLEIRDLAVGDASIDVTLHRHREGVGIDVERRSGELEVVAVR